jgi:putative restriction endonuclease
MTEPYLHPFTHLHTDASPARWPARTRHRAPHKPLLLLAVMDLFAEGGITINLIELTPDLGDLFTLYWACVMPPDRRGNVALPFFHLRSEGFWHLLPRPGQEAFLSTTRQIRSAGQLRDTVLGARLDEELYALLGVEQSRDLLRAALIQTYFAPELRPALMEQGIVNTESFRYSQKLLDKARARPLKEELEDQDAYRPAARDQGFRRAVVSAYDHRCALCGIRMLTPDGHTAVAAAHIVPSLVLADLCQEEPQPQRRSPQRPGPVPPVPLDL